MKGLRPDSLSNELRAVKPAHDQKPVLSIKKQDEKLGEWKQYIDENYGNDFSFKKDFHRLPLEAFKGFSFNELCKLKYSSPFTMDRKIEDLFETDPQYEIVRKIMSSMWRWGAGKGTWNELVEAYQNIRHFSFVENPDFEIMLDHATYFNPCGYAKYSRIFIDGAFAFLVYYKKEHVLTIGFSIMEERKLLIQQVQSTKRSGNRYLFKLPTNRMEFVINLFQTNFPGYTLFLIDGECLAEKTLADYQSALRATHERYARYARYQENIKILASESNEDYERYLRQSQEECETLANKISHLEADKARLAHFYAHTGKFVLGSSPCKVNGLTHYPVELQKEEQLAA